MTRPPYYPTHGTLIVPHEYLLLAVDIDGNEYLVGRTRKAEVTWTIDGPQSATLNDLETDR